jgi:hypothetical protein
MDAVGSIVSRSASDGWVCVWIWISGWWAIGLGITNWSAVDARDSEGRIIRDNRVRNGVRMLWWLVE